MPSPAEHSILLSVLTAVFASLPFAILIRSFFSQPDGAVAAQRAAMRMAAEAVPAQVIAPPPIPPPWGNQAIPEISPDPWMPPHSDLVSPVKGPAERSWTRKDAWFAVFLAIVVALLLFPVSGTGDAEASGSSDRLNVPLTTLFTISIIVQGAMVALVLVWLGVHRRFNVVSLFGLRRMSFLKSAGVALLVLIPAWFGLNYITYYLEPLLRYLTGLDVKPQMMVEKASEINGLPEQVLMFVTLCVGAPLMEELIFRGVLFSVASRFIHPVYANVATSLLFGVIHNNLLVLIPLTLLGMLFAYVYQRTRSLAVPVLMHAMFNGFQFLFLVNGWNEAM